jgi:crotonobetainyl-CoA:carnitine CoA-transferase CaiB-like acyl-CoA transferase
MLACNSDESMEQPNTTALGHLKVLDLTRVLAGPWATQNLADLGAEVIKIERPEAGDDTRGWGPPFLKDAEGHESLSSSSYFLSCNRGKKSVTADLSSPEGQQIVKKLAQDADVFVENYKVGTLARYGLGYQDLSKLNPRLIYCSITGFGQDGPYAALPGYDFVFQGLSGFMSINGQPDEEGGMPVKCGIAIADILTGMYASTAILSAIEHRNRSGKGQHIDLALLDCMVGFNSYQAVNYMLSGKIPKRMGNGHPNMVPYQVFRCKEGNVIVAVGNDSQFAAYCNVIGRPELASDPRFVTVNLRNQNRGVLIPMLAEMMMERTMQQWVEKLEAAKVPCGPINNMEQVFADPQVQHRGLRISLPHSSGVEAPGLANPIRLSDTPIQYTQAPPSLGEHNSEILGGRLGMSSKELQDLHSKGVI